MIYNKNLEDLGYCLHSCSLLLLFFFFFYFPDEGINKLKWNSNEINIIA